MDLILYLFICLRGRGTTQKNTKFSKYISLKEDILVLLRKNNINFIDIDKVFRSSSKNIESFFPLNFYGHYSIKGYSIVAESIANYIKR